MDFDEGKKWMELLKLTPHPEGGYYRQTYPSRTGETKNAELSASRSGMTSIYYLLESGDFSSWHRLKSVEIWHFYAGSPLLLYRIDSQKALSMTRIGNDMALGELPQVIVSPGHWMAAKVGVPGSFSLVGCTVSPGFVFEEFELGKRDDLVGQYPQYSEVITELTRG